METEPIKKEAKINKNGWLPFLVIVGGLIVLIIILKWLLAALGI